jgi:hypothetical protein
MQSPASASVSPPKVPNPQHIKHLFCFENHHLSQHPPRMAQPPHHHLAPGADYRFRFYLCGPPPPSLYQLARRPSTPPPPLLLMLLLLLLLLLLPPLKK